MVNNQNEVSSLNQKVTMVVVRRKNSKKVLVFLSDCLLYTCDLIWPAVQEGQVPLERHICLCSDDIQVKYRDET